jgi:hypothetical protein
MEIAGQKAKHVERVLDVRQGELGWVIGTVYMDLPLKPNVLEDLARDVRAPLCFGREINWSSILLLLLRLEKNILMRMVMCQLCLRMRVDA